MATIRVNDQIKEKIEELKNIHGDKSTNETIKRFLPMGTTTKEEYMQEPPAFLLSTTPVSWTNLKTCKVGDEWEENEIYATVIFKDDYGVLLRFMEHGETWVEYFHFLI